MEKSTPEQLAQRQLDAYNGKKIEEFCDVYTDNVVVMDFGTNKITLEGKEAFKVRYNNLFEANPNLNARLVNRVVKGNHVIDHEHITGRADGNESEAVAIYEVNDYQIEKVWFIK
ncbi:nuclear transport factor 2 family protein [Cytobacillus suaedae]|nr:nuclear transport factor 2 family protein [Cytobacillus suaedae]